MTEQRLGRVFRQASATSAGSMVPSSPNGRCDTSGRCRRRFHGRTGADPQAHFSGRDEQRRHAIQTGRLVHASHVAAVTAALPHRTATVRVVMRWCGRQMIGCCPWSLLVLRRVTYQARAAKSQACGRKTAGSGQGRQLRAERRMGAVLGFWRSCPCLWEIELAVTRSWRQSAREAWARSIAPGTHNSIGRSRSDPDVVATCDGPAAGTISAGSASDRPDHPPAHLHHSRRRRSRRRAVSRDGAARGRDARRTSRQRSGSRRSCSGARR